jgi:amidophosphoribosyltransferase
MLDKFKDECGVFGIFGHPESANMTYLGLYALQHRGQESAGIATSDGQQVRVSRAMGYVADVFDGEMLSQLPGRMAIGHVRYSTAGESRLANAQPFLIDCAHGQIAAKRSRGPGLDLPVRQRHRGRPAPLRTVTRAHGG